MNYNSESDFNRSLFLHLYIMTKKLFYFTTRPYGEASIFVSIGLTKDELVNAFDPKKHPENFNFPMHLKQIKKNVVLRECLEIAMTDCDHLRGLMHSWEDQEGERGYLIHIDPTHITHTDFILTIAHEVLHLCQRHLSIYFNRNVEVEAEAYFHEDLTKRIVKAYMDDEENDFSFE